MPPQASAQFGWHTLVAGRGRRVAQFTPITLATQVTPDYASMATSNHSHAFVFCLRQPSCAAQGRIRRTGSSVYQLRFRISPSLQYIIHLRGGVPRSAAAGGALRFPGGAGGPRARVTVHIGSWAPVVSRVGVLMVSSTGVRSGRSRLAHRMAAYMPRPGRIIDARPGSGYTERTLSKARPAGAHRVHACYRRCRAGPGRRAAADWVCSSARPRWMPWARMARSGAALESAVIPKENRPR